VKIQISKIYFNDGRTTSEISFAPKVLTFGTTTMPLPESVPPTVDAAVAPPATVIVPPLAPSPTSESSQTIQQTPDASTVASPESSFPTTIPEVPTTELTMTPPSSEIPAGAPVTSETTTETVTTSPTSSETTTPPPTTTAEASDPVVPPSVDPITPPSSETPPASTTIVEAVYIPLL
jgi:hypothetical protein